MVEYDRQAAIEIERAYLTPEMAKQRALTVEALGLAPGQQVLDVGCGTGLLARQLADAVGPGGRVVGVDISPDMLRLGRERCAGISHVQLAHGSAESLAQGDDRFDAVTCIQVLLYVADVTAALAGMHRALRCGGRIALIETDWRGVVLAGADDTLSRRIFAAWDDAVPSPNLPGKLGPLLRRLGFSAVRVQPIPVLSTNGSADGFAGGMLRWIARHASERGVVSAEQAAAWLAELDQLDRDGAFFFCVNRFLFTASKT